MVWTVPSSVAFLKLVWTQALCSVLSLAHGNQVQTKGNNSFLSRNIFRPHEVSCFFFGRGLLVVLGFRGPQRLVCREKFGGCETSLCFFCSVSHCYLHGSDTIYLTVHFVLLRQGKSTQNKPGASALSLCAGLSLPSHGHIPLLIQYSLSFPSPACFLWHLLLVSLSSYFHFMFLWGPGS